MDSLISDASFEVFPYLEAYLIHLWLLWAILLFWPLSFIDLKCDLSNWIYALFLMAAGVVLILAAPKRYNTSQDFPIHLTYACIWLILSLGRWWLLKKKRSAIKIRKFDEAKT